MVKHLLLLATMVVTAVVVSHDEPEYFGSYTALLETIKAEEKTPYFSNFIKRFGENKSVAEVKTRGSEIYDRKQMNDLDKLHFFQEQGKQNEIVDMANKVRVIIPPENKRLLQGFLDIKREHGTFKEKAVYGTPGGGGMMSWQGLVARLYQKRPAIFGNRGEGHTLRFGNRSSSDGDHFRLIGTYGEKKPYLLRDLQSYDEMALSASLSVAVPTFFINDGAIGNNAIKSDMIIADSPVEGEGVYVAQIGPSLEIPDVMEWKHQLITKTQNTCQNGYGNEKQHDACLAGITKKGKLGEAQKNRIQHNFKMMRLWADFYQVECFPTHDNLRACGLDREKHITYISSKDAEFNHKVHQKWAKMKARHLLDEAVNRVIALRESNAARKDALAFVHATGLGTGIWAVDDAKQWKMFIRGFCDLVKSDKTYQKYIGHIHFGYTNGAVPFGDADSSRSVTADNPCSDISRTGYKFSKPLTVEADSGLFSKSGLHGIQFNDFPMRITVGNKAGADDRNPASKLRGSIFNPLNPGSPERDYLLVANYAWNSNSAPGNEYWQGDFTGSGAPVAVAASNLGILQNMWINKPAFSHQKRLAVMDRMKPLTPPEAEALSPPKAKALTPVELPNVLKKLTVFRERNWYHFFPVERNIGSNDIFEVTDDFCRDKCTHMKSPHWYGDCKPVHLDRTLVWYNSDPKTTLENETKGENNGDGKGSSAYGNLYLMKKGGWMSQSRREIWRDFPLPQQLRSANVRNTKIHFEVKSIGKIDLENQSKSISEKELATSVCSRLHSSDNDIDEQTSPWISERDGVQLPFHHKLIWSSRDLTDGEIKKVIRSNWSKVDNTARVNGKNGPVFCDHDTKKAHREWVRRGSKEEDAICNVFYVENGIKSMPHVPHVHVFILRAKGCEKKHSDGRLYGSHNERIGGKCTWSEMVRGQKYDFNEEKKVDGEIALFDSQAECFFNFDLGYTHATVSETRFKRTSPSCFATFKAHKGLRETTCVKDYLNKLEHSGRKFPETDFDYLVTRTMLKRDGRTMLVKPEDLTSDGTFAGRREWDLESYFGLCDRKCAERDGFQGVVNRDNYRMFKSTEEYIRYIRERVGLPRVGEKYESKPIEPPPTHHS